MPCQAFTPSLTFYVIPLLCRVNALSGIHDLPAYLSTSLLEPLHRLYSIFALSTNVLYKVEAFNQGLKVVSTPLWLTSEACCQSQQGGSMLLTFVTEAEATQAVCSRLWISAQSVRVEHAKDKDID